MIELIFNFIYNNLSLSFLICVLCIFLIYIIEIKNY